jgi:DNA-binding response OmpR family regulator
MHSDPLTFLVVENHPDTLESIRGFLEAQGYAVESAADMATALDFAARKRFDVLISDIGLPDGDGWELLRRLRVGGWVRAIAMSGFGTKADVDKSRSAGFSAHLVKPFGPAELNSAVRKALGTAIRDMRPQ